MRRSWKRWSALLIVAAMTLSLLPVTSLATGEDGPINLLADATEDDVYVSGGLASTDNNGKAKVIDGEANDDGPKWVSNNMKINGDAGACPAWVTVDLGENVGTLSQIKIKFFKAAWASDYVVQIAGSNYEPTDITTTGTIENPETAAQFTGDHAVTSTSVWTTIKTYEGRSYNGNQEVTVIDTGAETPVNPDNALPSDIRYLRFYFTKVNSGAALGAVGVIEITATGTRAAATTPEPPDEPVAPAPSTRYEDWTRLGTTGTLSKTVSADKNEVTFPGVATDGSEHNFNNSSNSVWLNTTINAALNAYTPGADGKRFVSFDITASQEGVWAVGLWTVDKDNAFQLCYNKNGAWFTEYFYTGRPSNDATLWPNWTTGKPSGNFGTSKHHVKIEWTTPTAAGTNASIVLTLDGTEYTVPVNEKYQSLSKTTQNFAIRAGSRTDITVSNVRYSGEPAGQAVFGTVKNGEGAGIANATVILGGMTATTDASGVYSFDYVQKGTYTATVKVAGYKTNTSTQVEVGDTAVTGADVTMEGYNRVITGTITAGGAGAKVTLVGTAANHYPTVAGFSATTAADGTYSMNINALPAGTYSIRASKDGYNAVIGEAFTTTTGEEDITYDGKNATLTAIDTSVANKKFEYDMSVGHRPSLGISTATNHPEYSYDGDALTLSFKNIARMDNLVKLTGTNMGNGTIEFDATRTGTYTSPGRFGLAFRLTDNNHWIFVGQWDNDSTAWSREYWYADDGSHNWNNVSPIPEGETGVTNRTGPSFGKGDTRHFKVTIEDTALILEIDGITVIQSSNIEQGGHALPSAAADVGFICGNEGYGVPCEVTIDNLYILRTDAVFPVTLGSAANGSITAATVNTGAGGNVSFDSGAEIATKEAVVITGAPTSGYALHSVTVTKTGDASTTVATTKNEDGTYTFEMPAYPVTVTGTFLPELTSVTLTETSLKVGGSVGTTVMAGTTTATSGVTYQWQHKDGENWVDCTNASATTATKTPGTDDENKLVRVIVTGDGTSYTGTVTSGQSSAAIAPADVAISSVSLDKTSEAMLVGGTLTATATLTSAETGKEPTAPKSIEWTSSDTSVATVAKSATDAKQATVTAVANGSATITITVTDALDNVKTDTFTVTVTTKVTGITVAPQSGDATIYTNKTGDTTVQLEATVTPGDASNKAVTWASSDHNVATISETGLVTAVGVGETDITATANDGSGVASTAYKITVKAELSGKVGVSGTAKNGQTLTANPATVEPAGARSGLTYQWYRGTTAITGATTSTYTLTTDDVNAAIKVVASAATNSFYEGSAESDPTAAVAKKDGPAAPTGLTGTDCTNGDNGEISGLTTTTAYEYSTDGTNWNDAAVTAEGKIENLAAGTYYIRVKVTDTAGQEEGASSTGIVILAEGASAHDITVDGTITNGTVTVSKNKADASETITITVTPDGGFQLKANTLKVSGASGDVTVSGSASPYTFSMPDEAVTVTAQFEVKTYTVTDSLGTNVSCNLSGESAHVIAHGQTLTITLSVPEGYELPTSVTVTEDDHDEWHGYTYDHETGVLTINGADVVDNLTVSCAAAVKKTFTIGHTLTHVTCSLGLGNTEAHKVAYGEDKPITLTAEDGYHVPAALTAITMGGAAMTKDPAAGQSGYTYVVNADGTATLTLKKVTAAVSFTVVAEQDRTPIESVSITTHHDVEGVTGAPHVGDTLDAVVAPDGATVSYQWKSDNVAIEGATSANYQVAAGDQGKAITVTVTGTGDYEGEKTSDPTGNVQAAYVLPTGITLDKTTADVAMFSTLTLTATVAPDNATDKTVTWTTSDAAVATVANGVVTPVSTGSATITAEDAAGHTASCVVTVTKASVTGVSISGIAQVGNELRAVVTPATATVTYKWFRDGIQNMNVASDSATYSLTGDDQRAIIKVEVTGTGNYEGTVDFSIPAAVLGEDEEAEKYDITVVTADNGTVTADKESAAAGETVTLTVTPAVGYALESLTVADEDEAPVTVAADNTFIMPAKAVTVTAAFVESETPDVEGVTLNKSTASLTVGGTETLTVTLAPEGAVAGSTAWTSSNESVATVDENGKVTAVAAGTANITVKVNDDDELTATCAVTVANPSSNTTSSSRPATSTTTSKNEDGSTTTTVTNNRTGTVTETTKKADGTVEVVETKKDGTVTETVTTPEGEKTETITEPDGTVTETVTTPEGQKTQTVSEPNGTVTTTDTAPNGTEVMTVAQPEKNVTAKITLPKDVSEATVTVPAQLSATTVAKNVETGEIIVLSVPTENGMAIKVEGSVNIELVDNGKEFVDMPGHWAEESVNFTAAREIFQGTGEDHFSPTVVVDRAMMVTILARFDGENTTGGDTWYTKGAEWAQKNEISDGKELDRVISREELVTMIYRYAKLKGMGGMALGTEEALKAYGDTADVSDWAAEAMAWAVENGIIKGTPGNTLSPKGTASRAEVSTIMHRFCQILVK